MSESPEPKVVYESPTPQRVYNYLKSVHPISCGSSLRRSSQPHSSRGLVSTPSKLTPKLTSQEGIIAPSLLRSARSNLSIQSPTKTFSPHKGFVQSTKTQVQSAKIISFFPTPRSPDKKASSIVRKTAKRPLTSTPGSKLKSRGRNYGIKVHSSSPDFVTSGFLSSRRSQLIDIREHTEELVPTLPDKEFHKIYLARCQDLRIRTTPLQEERFINYMKLHSVNGKLIMIDSNIGMCVAGVVKSLLLKDKYHISHLDLRKNGLGDSGIKTLAKGMRNSQSLVHVDLASNEIKKEGADALFEELLQNQSINCLSIGNAKGLHRNFLNGHAVVGLGLLLEKHAQLTILDLQGASIGNEGLNSIYNGIIQSKSLKVLNLAFNMITSVSNKVLAEMMGKSGVKRIDLSQNLLGDSFKFELNSSTKTRIFLQTHLNLSKCGFYSYGTFVFLEALRKDPCLTNLSLGECRFANEELPALRTFLFTNTSLRIFSLKGCAIGNRGAEAVADGIIENSFLSELNLSENKISDDGARKLAKNISGNRNSRLLTLDLSNNYIEDAGGLEMAKMIAMNKPLSILNLCNNKLRDEFALAVIVNLKQNKRLTKILLSENVIDLKHIRTIENMLKSNKVLARKRILPVYQQQLDRLQVNPSEYGVTQRKILEVDNECRAEKAIRRQNAEALKKTQTKQLLITTKVTDRKKKVDEELAAAEKRLVDAEETNKDERAENEKGIATMYKKIKEVNRAIESLANEINEMKNKIHISTTQYKDQISQLQAKLGDNSEIMAYSRQQKEAEKNSLKVEIYNRKNSPSPKRVTILEPVAGKDSTGTTQSLQSPAKQGKVEDSPVKSAKKNVKEGTKIKTISIDDVALKNSGGKKSGK